MPDQPDNRFPQSNPPGSSGATLAGTDVSSLKPTPPTGLTPSPPGSSAPDSPGTVAEPLSPAQSPPPPPPSPLPPPGETVEPGQPITPSPSAVGTPPPPPAEVETAPSKAATPPHPKRAFPKKIILFIVIVLLLGVIGFVASRILPTGVSLGGETELTWWGLWEDDSVVEPLIAEYEQENPRVTVTYINQSPRDYRERLTNALAKGEGPDIFRFHNSWVPMFKNELDSLPSSVMTPGEYAKTYYPVISSDMTSGASLVGIPLGYDALALYINEDIFAQAAKSPPRTWDELRRTALELTVTGEKELIIQSGVALGQTENVDHWPEILALMMLQNGVNLARPVGPLAEDALKFYSIFATVDGVWDETLPPSTVAFASGKLAMYFGPTWRSFEIKRQNPDLRFRVVPLPQLPKEDPSQPDISYATYWVEGVWNRSKNRQAAWEFLKFLSSRESLEKLYANASRLRLFGEPYPRVDMRELLADHPIIGSVISEATSAKSWYLAERTFDGPTGINSQLKGYFGDVISTVNSGKPAKGALETLSSGVSQVLTQYGLTRQQ